MEQRIIEPARGWLKHLTELGIPYAECCGARTDGEEYHFINCPNHAAWVDARHFLPLC